MTNSHTAPPFDFDDHKRTSIEAYRAVRPLYEAFAQVVKSVLEQALSHAAVRVASVDARAKSLESFGTKTQKRHETDPSQPMYPDPLKDITDLAAARVITFFLRTINEVDALIASEFEVEEKSDKSDFLLREERLGYQSVHYLVRLKDNRTSLPEYSRYKGMIAEIQLRTVLQHAWAEIEHDIQYKSVEAIPSTVRRRFLALAGLLEIADREFQAVQEQDEDLRVRARRHVELGHLNEVEVTPDALKAYLDKRLGADGRMADWAYESNAAHLRRLGFANLAQIDKSIAPYDDDKLSRTLHGSRMGQLSRFEDMMLAAIGHRYVDGHTLNSVDWWRQWKLDQLDRMMKAGVPIGTYDPASDSANQGHAT